MIKLYNKIKERFRVKKVDKLGSIQEKHIMSMDEINKIYEEYNDKSLREGIYYLKGSPYMLEMIQKYPNPELLQEFFLKRFDQLDSCNPPIPLELGEFVYNLTQREDIVLGMHRSDSIKGDDPLEDPVLQAIMKEGLMNNGTAMQGLVTERVEPSQTISKTNDMITAFIVLKHSFRGSTGAVLVGLPSHLVNSQLEVVNQEDDKMYDVDIYGIKHIKPEFNIGYISTHKGAVKYYSRPEILSHIKEK